MTTLAQNTEYSLVAKGNSYMIIDNANTCVMVKATERSGKNYFNKISKLAGIN